MKEEYLEEFDMQEDPLFEVDEKIEKAKRKRRQKARTVLHAWTEEECFRLIAAVEERRSLWDTGSAAYRNARKEDDWAEVVGEVGDDIQIDDAKSKWMNLRSTFKTNSSKVRKTKSGQGANESVKVHWRFFEALMFLEGNDAAISATPAPASAADQSLLSDLGVAELSAIPVGQSTKRSRYTQTLTPPPAPSGASVNHKDITAHTLVHLKELDKHEAYGKYIAAELRALPEADGDALRQLFSRTLFNFLESRRIQ